MWLVGRESTAARFHTAQIPGNRSPIHLFLAGGGAGTGRVSPLAGLRGVSPDTGGQGPGGKGAEGKGGYRGGVCQAPPGIGQKPEKVWPAGLWQGEGEPGREEGPLAGSWGLWAKGGF